MASRYRWSRASIIATSRSEPPFANASRILKNSGKSKRVSTPESIPSKRSTPPW